MIMRKTNRRHMIGDHHYRTAARATLLVTAADEILGTHRSASLAGSVCTGVGEEVQTPCVDLETR